MSRMIYRWLLVCGTAVWVGLTAPLAEAAPCRIDAKNAHLRGVLVSPKGGDTFLLGLIKVPATIVPDRHGSARVHVKAPLRFTGDIKRMDSVNLQAARRVAILGGRVTLAAGLRPVSLGARGKALRIKAPLVGFSPRDKPLLVPCSALTVADKSNHYKRPQVVVPKGRMEHVFTKAPIPLYRSPREVGAVWMKFSVPLVVRARKGAWVKLQATWRDGSSVQGWVPNRLVEVRDERVSFSPPSVDDTSVGSGCGGYGYRLFTVTLNKNAPIRHKPGGNTWARTASDIDVRAFPISRADGWVKIARIDALRRPCGAAYDQAWVHVRHVRWARSNTPPNRFP